MILSLRRKLVSLNGEKKKGFTLVELLVVIAIIAILATVSTVGYLGFTKQAKISNDLTELTQYKTVITGLTMDGKTNEVKYKASSADTTAYITYSVESKTFVIAEKETTGETTTEKASEHAELALASLLGDDFIADGHLSVEYSKDADKTTEVVSIGYYHHYDGNKGTQNAILPSVVWTIATDTVAKVA